MNMRTLIEEKTIYKIPHREIPEMKKAHERGADHNYYRGG